MCGFFFDVGWGVGCLVGVVGVEGVGVEAGGGDGGGG